MSEPSDKAVEAAARKHADWEGLDWQASVVEQARQMLHAAHDPALGLAQSVCLRDVWAWLHENGRGFEADMVALAFGVASVPVWPACR